MRWLTFATLLAVVTGTGCSLLFVEGPPRDHAARPWFDCTQSRWAPALDTAWATANVLAAATGDGEVERPVAIAWALVAAASAVKGFRDTAVCRAATADLTARASVVPAPWPGYPAPGSWPPPSSAPPTPDAGADVFGKDSP